MSYQDRLLRLEPVETCETLESAAWERYWDGFELATQQTQDRTTGALYLLGYVVEVVLKVGFFRIIGIPAGTRVDLRSIRSHQAWTQNTNLHDIVPLARVLVAERDLRSKPLDPVFAGVLDRHVQILATHWSESVRYRATQALPEEIAEVYECAEWILANRETLWR
jgi:hypothetical protein